MTRTFARIASFSLVILLASSGILLAAWAVDSIASLTGPSEPAFPGSGTLLSVGIDRDPSADVYISGLYINAYPTGKTTGDDKWPFASGLEIRVVAIGFVNDVGKLTHVINDDGTDTWTLPLYAQMPNIVVYAPGASDVRDLDSASKNLTADLAARSGGYVEGSLDAFQLAGDFPSEMRSNGSVVVPPTLLMPHSWMREGLSPPAWVYWAADFSVPDATLDRTGLFSERDAIFVTSGSGDSFHSLENDNGSAVPVQVQACGCGLSAEAPTPTAVYDSGTVWQDVKLETTIVLRSDSWYTTVMSWTRVAAIPAFLGAVLGFALSTAAARGKQRHTTIPRALGRDRARSRVLGVGGGGPASADSGPTSRDVVLDEVAADDLLLEDTGHRDPPIEQTANGGPESSMEADLQVRGGRLGVGGGADDVGPVLPEPVLDEEPEEFDDDVPPSADSGPTSLDVVLNEVAADDLLLEDTGHRDPPIERSEP